MVQKMAEKDTALEFLTRAAEAIASTFGSNCETLIQDMQQSGHPIVAIFHSHGRQPGSTEDVFGSDLNPQMSYDYIQEDSVNTMVITKAGRTIKSTTIHYKGDTFHFALGINYDYTGLLPAMAIVRDLTETGEELAEHLERQRSLRIDEVFEDCVARIGKPIPTMKKRDKLYLIRLLKERKVFDLQKSVTYVAERLGTSRYTIYKYIHEIEENHEL